MNLAEFLAKGDQDLLASKAGTSRAYLYQLATGRRKASPKLARRIHEATAGAVSLASLRPEIWGADFNNDNAQAREVKGADEGRDDGSS